MSICRWLSVLLCLLLGCSASSTGKAPPSSASEKPTSPKLRILSASWPPFVDTDDNPRVAIDLVSAALARAGYIAVNEIGSIDAVMSELRAGSYDGSAALWRNEEREQYMLYSEPYLENRLLLVGKKGSDVAATSFAALSGKKVGIVQGYAYGPEVDGAKEPVFVRQESTDENLRSLLRGEIDYMLTDALVIHQLAQHYPKQTREKLELGSNTLVKRPLYMTLRRSLPDAERIMAAFNRELAKMVRDGSLAAALHVDWIEADIDGDGRPELVAGGDRIGTEAPVRGYKLVGAESGGSHDNVPSNARFVVKGVAYDTWSDIPDDHKAPINQPGSKPGTLRATVVQW
jgi:polar amino acid transport system substrate-binding protein